jgi:heptose-I-phosphate ethanolaminephosphotransferase
MITIGQQRRFPSPSSWLYLLLPSVLILAALLAAGTKSDALRLALLFLPGSYFAWRAAVTRRRAWRWLTHAWAFVFGADATLRAASWITYRSDLDSAFILEALANTTVAESGEFLLHYWHLLPVLVAGALSLNAWYLYCVPRLRSVAGDITIPRALVLFVLAALTLLAYGLRPNRAQHPVIYWSGYAQQIQTYRDNLANSAEIAHAWDRLVADDSIVYEGPDRQTFVLVLAESITRHNMQLCGYGRDTTPNLRKIRGELTVFCNAFSPAASTLPALRMKLTDANTEQPYAEREGSLLARARKAGFQLHWISNQDDEYTAALFGEYADHAVFTNRRSGRSSSSLDEALLAPFRAALADPHPRKLIVVHMIGAHPNYFLRYPPAFARFDAREDDSIDKALLRDGRNLITRRQRDHYDNALVYHDHVVTQLVEALRQATPDTQQKTLLYASDHGNEVGHVGNHVGHSPRTEAGYAVPVMLWQAGRTRLQALEQRPILTDSLDDNALRLMGVRWTGANRLDDWFAEDYAWAPPPDWPPWN